MNLYNTYFFLLSFFFISISIIVSNYFIIWGVLSFSFAVLLVKIGSRFSSTSLMLLCVFISLINYILNQFIFLTIYRRGEITLFGTKGDDSMYLNLLSSGGALPSEGNFGLTNYLNFPFFLKSIYSFGGLSLVFFLGWLFFVSASGILSWNLYKKTQERAFLNGYVFLIFFPDVYIWSNSLYKEIWVAASALFLLSVLMPVFLWVFGLLSLYFFRFVFIFPILVAIITERLHRLSLKRFVVFGCMLTTCFITILLFSFENSKTYFEIFFSEERLTVILDKTGLSSYGQLIVVSMFVVLFSPLIVLSTPLPVYFEKLVIFDNLWWMTVASGTFISYLLPWILSYRKKDVIFFSFLAISMFIVVSFLFLTNRHRFLVSVIGVFMGGVAYSKLRTPKKFAFSLTMGVLSLQLIILYVRGQL